MTGPPSRFARTEVRKLTLCPSCARRRGQFFWWVLASFGAAVVAAAVVGFMLR